MADANVIFKYHPELSKLYVWDIRDDDGKLKCRVIAERSEDTGDASAGTKGYEQITQIYVDKSVNKDILDCIHSIPRYKEKPDKYILPQTIQEANALIKGTITDGIQWNPKVRVDPSTRP